MGRPGVKRPLLGRNRLLLFRSYLFLVAGLLIVAFVLDFSFGQLQSSQAPPDQRWLDATFALIERDLSGIPADARERRAQELAAELRVGIQLFRQGDIAANANTTQETSTLIDADGNISHLRDAASIDAIVRLGPIDEPRESILLRLLPPLFYLSIFIVVGLWLRPLLRDINLITDGAQRFAADYREPLATADKATALAGLAKNLDDMSARLSGLIQSQKELIAALSHEMRTPLARIRFALAVIGNESDPELQRQLDALNTDVQEVDELISSMLNYARLDHPDLRMHWQKVPVHAWLHKAVEKCSQPGTEIRVSEDDSIDRAWMDPRLMELAVSNLLVNACRYADGQVKCGATREQGEYTIAIEDNGKGIPEAERDTVFKAFTRIDDSRNRETGGYGLGLAIVARIIDLHGGNVNIETSADLGGAKFVLRWKPPPGD
ncbi:MAG: ATP-binding protein [Gammaproteobacteria bacterium]|nr:ATP-binding protein [Gammaproteobacteria bacterium]